MLHIGSHAKPMGEGRHPLNTTVWDNCQTFRKRFDKTLQEECQSYLAQWANESFLHYANERLFGIPDTFNTRSGRLECDKWLILLGESPK